MNLVNGRILDNNEARDALERLGELVLEARFSAPPSAETVIAACEKLGAMGDEPRTRGGRDQACSKHAFEEKTRKAT